MSLIDLEVPLNFNIFSIKLFDLETFKHIKLEIIILLRHKYTLFIL